MEEKQRISAKKAFEYASKYFEELVDRPNITIEEAEIDETGEYWFVTLGFDTIFPGEKLIFSKRGYKIFKIHAYTGQVISMKIRQI